MNAVEIEEAISELAAAPFDAGEFPFAFLRAFGNKDTTIKRLKSGSSNASDVDGGVLQSREIHLATCAPGKTTETLTALRNSPKTAQRKVKFILATDGDYVEAEELATGEARYFQFQDLAKQFGFFLPLAGISTTKEIKNAEIDIKATGRLNKLYLALIEENEDWGTEARRHDLNQFMARVVFCFFAEDTGIFHGENLFTRTVEQMSDSRSGNTHEVIAELFRAMDTKLEERANKKIKSWADVFPYVNGGLFDGTKDVPHFNRNARNFLLHAGKLDWKRINPDIFGSMIQAVADDEERGSLGMHYTSVPNILKVLNPLFLDDLRQALEKADTVRKLKALRRRIASIRVFDPACGSGNFLVVAYIHMREIEWEIVKRLRKIQQDANKDEPNSWIRLENFYGIDIKDFAVETAKLALLIAEFQMNVRLIGEIEARLQVLPLNKTGQIHCGNALRMDWLEICPPARPAEAARTDLFADVAEQSEIDFDVKDVETYICGNPPYRGSTWLTADQKDDLKQIFSKLTKKWRALDYVSGWFMKATNYGSAAKSSSAFVATNSICQGQQVPVLWPIIFQNGREIFFAHTSFKWTNLASHNAGVIVVIIGLNLSPATKRKLFIAEPNANSIVHEVRNINAYLVSADNVFVERVANTPEDRAEMVRGNMPYDGGNLLLLRSEIDALNLSHDDSDRFIHRVFGSSEFIRGGERYCIWIEDRDAEEAIKIESIAQRIEEVRAMRLASSDKGANALAARPHQFREMNAGEKHTIVMPRVSSENRQYLPAGLLGRDYRVTDLIYALYDAPLWNFALLASRTHLVWIATVCGKMKSDFRYSNTMGWNTFPVPKLTEKNKADLTTCAEDILLAREAHFPATIADLYDPEKMPENLRRAHDRNDETLERIYIGRRFRNDTERLEKLFELYTKMTAETGKSAKN